MLIIENLIIKRNSDFLRSITGVDSESVQEQLLFLKTTDATIADADDFDLSEIWNLHIEKADYFNLNSDSSSFLKNQKRMISIRHLLTKDYEDGDFATQQTIIFLENDMY